jgi:hypothetical protein
LKPSSVYLNHFNPHLTSRKAKVEATIKTMIESILLLKLFLNAYLPLSRALRDLTICKIAEIITPYFIFLNA